MAKVVEQGALILCNIYKQHMEENIMGVSEDYNGICDQLDMIWVCVMSHAPNSHSL